MNFQLSDRTIFLVLSGSRAYGFATEASDWDYRGIAIPPMDSYIGLESKFEQAVDKDLWKIFPDGMVHSEADMQVMEICKFARLAAMCNPSVIEILFSPDSAIVKKLPIMDKLLESRDLFLSKQAKARFCGYALSQLNRIKRHRKWLISPPDHQPTRAEFGLPEYKILSLDQLGAAESLIQKEVDEFVVDQNNLSEDTKIELNNGLGRMMKAVWAAIHTEPYPIGDGMRFSSTEEALFDAVAKDQQFSDNFIEVLRRERQYRVAKQQWHSYQTWLKERNHTRAELEKKYGFDCKHAGHLYRLLKMAREILEAGQVHVARPDAEEIKAIRNGAWTYEQIVEFAEKEDISLNDIMARSKLPKSPPMDKIHKIVFEMVTSFNGAFNA